MRSNFIPKLFLAVLFLSFFSAEAYAQKVLPIDTSKTIDLRIDPANANGGNASEVFESVNYIPLETTKESTFGRIEQLEVTDDRFIILDENTNSILIFKKDGKFQGKIYGGSYKGPETYMRIRDFKVNRWNNEIMFSKWDPKTEQQTHYFFDFAGKKIREIINPSKSTFLYDGRFLTKDLMVLGENRYDDSKYDGVKTRYLLKYLTDLKKTEARALPYEVASLEIGDDMMNVASGPFFHYGTPSAAFFVKPNDYHIFKVTPNSIERSYRFIFPLINALPADFVYNKGYKDKRMKYLKDHPDAIYGLGNCFLMGDNLTFKATCSNSDFKLSSMIYNLKSGTLIALGHITTDALSYFLPVADDRMYSYTGFVACDGKNLYSSFPSIVMFQAHEANQDKGIKYNTVLNEYFSNGKKEDNPVIVQIKLKDNL